MDYACAPNESTGNRISDMRLDDGAMIDAHKSYRVAGWASVNPQSGKPVTDVVAAYLRAEKIAKAKRPNRVTLKGVANNPGIAEGG
jgi:S-sulfosulfanyl-L-cysteine sulfohydrolase